MERLLDKIDQLGVIRKYYPNIKINKAMKSPFRDEKHASCCLHKGKRNGDYIFIDYGGDNKAMTCIDLVMHMEGVDVKRAIEIIKTDGFAKNLDDKEYTKVEEELSNSFQISFKFNNYETTDWKPEHIDWMKKFRIDRDVIIENNIIPIKWYELHFSGCCVKFFDERNKPSEKDSSTGIIWGIFEDVSNKKAKFYHPYADKNKKWKALNISPNFIFGYNGIMGEMSCLDYPQEKVILCAGNKDTLILQSMGYKAISLNSESKKVTGTIQLMIEKILNESNTNTLNILYDWDKSGIEFGKRISEQIKNENCSRVNTNLVPMQNILKPKYLNSTKDIGDLAIKDYVYLCELLDQVLA